MIQSQSSKQTGFIHDFVNLSSPSEAHEESLLASVGVRSEGDDDE